MRGPSLALGMTGLWAFVARGVKPRNVCSGPRLHIRAPSELSQNRIWLFLNGVSNDFAKHGREFESVAAITGSYHQSFALWIPRDPKMSVVRVAIHAHARINNWRLCECSKR